MKQLITWIVASQPFKRSAVPLARSEWVAANEKALQQIQLAEVVFAAGSSLGASSDSRNLGRSLEVAKRWSGSNTLASGDVMLAQPDLAKPRKGRNGKPAKEQPMPPMSFAIHGERFLPSENEYIQRLAEDERLSWEQKAEHVLLLSEYEHLGDRNRALAAGLLDQFDGNEEAALRTLLWAVKNSSAN